MTKHRFRPLPLLGNPHVQTVLSAFWPVPEPSARPTVRQLMLPDGDRMVLVDDRPARWAPGDPAAILIHGLGGSHRSGIVCRVASGLVRAGWRAIRVNLRGSWPGIRLSRGAYHAGSWPDVRAVAAWLAADAPGTPIALVGFSLGASLVLKLGAEAADVPVPGLARVASVAAPLDIEESIELIVRPPNRGYDRFFIRDLVRRARVRARIFPDLPPLRLPYLPTGRVWDELYTAPRNGYRNAIDYYEKCSAGADVHRIPVPALLLTSRDDPFIGVGPYERLNVPSHIDVRIEARGGHLGFIGWDGRSGLRWADRQVVEWLLRS